MFRREIEPLGIDENMRRYILEVKSWRTRMLIKNMSVYHFDCPESWENLLKREGIRERGY